MAKVPKRMCLKLRVPANVECREFVPQSALLAHPKARYVFIGSRSNL